MTSAKEIKIPDVTNMSQSEAVKTLQDAGFKVSDDILSAASDDVAEGNIVKTKPVAGTKKTKGTEVTLYASSGNATYTLDDYKGKNYLTVQGTLQAYGIYVIPEKKDVDDASKYEGTEVIDQSPAAGEKVSAGDTVILYIPNVIVKYPDFTDGYTVDQVKEFCKKNNIKLVVNPDVVDGKIVSQSRQAGTTVAAGTTLKIEVDINDVSDPDNECSEFNPDACKGLTDSD